MPLSIMLGEEDFRSMDQPLREGLLKWYFERPQTINATPAASQNSNPFDNPTTVSEIEDAQSPETTSREEEGFKRVEFGEFLRAGLISVGDDIWCRSLKREVKRGAPEFIKGAKVTETGSVEFQGQKFFKPSKLALAMVNSNQNPKPAPAVNGYDYLFVKSGGTLVSIKKKREELMSDADFTMPSRNGSYGEAMGKAESLARKYSTAENPLTARVVLRTARNWAEACSQVAPDKPYSLQAALSEVESWMEGARRKRMQSPSLETE